MLAASNDLIDMMHEHPFLADGGPQRRIRARVSTAARIYRIWVQFQSDGVVNTVISTCRSGSRTDRPCIGPSGPG